MVGLATDTSNFNLRSVDISWSKLFSVVALSLSFAASYTTLSSTSSTKKNSYHLRTNRESYMQSSGSNCTITEASSSLESAFFLKWIFKN